MRSNKMTFYLLVSIFVSTVPLSQIHASGSKNIRSKSLNAKKKKEDAMSEIRIFLHLRRAMTPLVLSSMLVWFRFRHASPTGVYGWTF